MQRRNVLLTGMTLLSGLVAIGAWWYFDWGHNAVERIPHLHGQPFEVVLAELGQPDEQLEYSMKERRGGEFGVELYNTYPPDDPKASEAQIKELQWHRARYHIAVWMHQVNGVWVVLDTCRWKEGIAF